MLTFRKKTISFILVFLFLISFLFSTFPINQVKALENKYPFDSVSVESDLKGSSIINENYPFEKFISDSISNKISKKGHLNIFDVVEYGYPHISSLNRDDFALYVYIYNQSNLNIDKNSSRNTINICDNYDEDGNPINYNNYELVFCNLYSTTKDNVTYNLYYKFRIKDFKYTAPFVNVDSVRRYDIGSIDILISGDTNATAFKVGGTYQFSGYMEKYGVKETDKSTLKSEGVKTLETLELDVKHTYYKPDKFVSTLDNTTQYSLSSVYFNVPKWIIEKYGDEADSLKGLKNVSCNWYEYRLKPQVVLFEDVLGENFEDIYNSLLEKQGIKLPTNSHGCFCESNNLGFVADYSKSYDHNMRELISGDFSYNVCHNSISEFNFYKKYKNVIDTISLVLKKESKCDVSSEEILDQLYALSDKYKNENLDDSFYSFNGELDNYLKERKLISSLFFDKLEDGSANGYREMNILSTDEFSFTAYELQNFFEWLFGVVDKETYSIPAIRRLDSSDLNYDASLFSEKYYVAENDVSEIKDSYSFLSETYFLAFDFDIYESSYINYFERNGDRILSDLNYGYVAETNVYFDFDIIDLTFENSDGQSFVIPVTASPKDMVDDGTLPLDPDGCSFGNFGKIFLLILFIILFIFLLPYLPSILGFVFKIVIFPFKQIGKTINRTKLRSQKKLKKKAIKKAKKKRKLIKRKKRR